MPKSLIEEVINEIKFVLNSYSKINNYLTELQPKNGQTDIYKVKCKYCDKKYIGPTRVEILRYKPYWSYWYQHNNEKM